MAVKRLYVRVDVCVCVCVCDRPEQCRAKVRPPLSCVTQGMVMSTFRHWALPDDGNT
jgi:hypothetical protein